jgi:hypothetical protein
MQINWQKTILAGIIGTILFDILGFLFTGTFWDIPGLLAEKAGYGFAAGVAGHYANGILLAILYAGIRPSLWGPDWARALTFVVAETVALVWFFMFPLLGAGIAGLAAGAMMPVISLLRHVVYGIPLAFLIKEKANEPAAKFASA